MEAGHGGHRRPSTAATVPGSGGDELVQNVVVDEKTGAAVKVKAGNKRQRREGRASQPSQPAGRFNLGLGHLTRSHKYQIQFTFTIQLLT